VRFSVLGAVGIADGPHSVPLRPSKPTALLAALLVRPNQTASIAFLTGAVWDGPAADSAKATLQVYILRLRRLFQKFGIDDSLIETVPSGYRFAASVRTLDLVEFRELVKAAAAEPDPEAELDALRRALGLWSGPPLANIRSESLHRDVVPHLVEEWLRAAERRFDLTLDLGRHREVTAELWTAVRAHPGHERFREQLIEALYRSGRQADALAEYRAVKEYLREELGIFPGAGLRQLEMTILRGEEMAPREIPHPRKAFEATVSLLMARLEPVAEDAGIAGIEQAGTEPADPQRYPVPPDLPHFVGRETEAELLAARLTAHRGGPLVAVVSGAPGIGKTALAVHVAHRLGGHFPGGRHFVPAASGASESGSPAAGPFAAPGTLVVIDDAADPAAVRPLLPTGDGSAAIVTGRTSLAALATASGGWMMRLGPLTGAGAAELLASVLGGERVAAEPDAVAGLAELCARHPAALRIAAARLLVGPAGQGVADHLAWLGADPVRRLSLSTDPAMSLRIRFERYLAGLDPRLVDAWIRLAAEPSAEVSAAPAAEPAAHPTAHPTADLTVDTCAAAWDLDPDAAEQLLAELVDVSLVELGRGAGYVLEPLLCRIARDLSRPALTA
jgi:DNA-binding SARP family transcriptional activator